MLIIAHYNSGKASARAVATVLCRRALLFRCSLIGFGDKKRFCLFRDFELARELLK